MPLVFCDKFLSLGEAIPSNEGVKEGYPLKDVILPPMTRLAWKRLQINN